MFTVRSHYLNESKIIDFKLSDGIENRVYNNDNKKKSWKNTFIFYFGCLGMAVELQVVLVRVIIKWQKN